VFAKDCQHPLAVHHSQQRVVEDYGPVNQYLINWEEEKGTDLGKRWGKVMTALSNNHYSGHHKATEVEETKEHMEERFQQRNVGNGFQAQLR